MIKKIIINALCLLSIVTLQYTNIIQFIAFREVVPDILFILVMLNGIFIDPMFAMIFGTAGGLLLDVIGGGLVGFNAMIYATIGYLTFLPQKRIDIDNVILHILAFFLYFIIKTAVYLILGSIFMEKSELADYLKNRMLIEAIYTLLLSLPIFYIYNKVCSRKNTF